MCEVLNVSKSGYFASIDREPSERARRHERIKAAVAQVHEESHGIYGSFKIVQVLQEDDQQESACRNTVAAAMREMGLKSRVTKGFTATAPNRKWVADITYLPTAAGWVYLAVVLDLFSRKVLGWAMSNSLATELVSTALRQAMEARRLNGRELLHHSDRGSQYISGDYQ